jgi:hypothetical protein
MAIEQRWAGVPPQAFIADGSSFGLITLADTAGFKVKQVAALIATGVPTLPVQIKRVISSTQLIVGSINNAQIGQWPPLNISAYTVAGSATISAEQQPKSNIKPDDIEVATYEADPTVARRVVLVDQYGNIYSDTNPLPATFTGTITIGTVEITGPSGHLLDPNSDGSLNVKVEGSPSGNFEDFNSDGSAKSVGLFNLPYDTIEATYPSATQEVYVSLIGGPSGTTQQTVTVNYTDSTKNFITSVLRTPLS